MIAQVVEAKPQHCGQMVHSLRAEHRALMVRMGVRTHHEIRDRFAGSSLRKAMFIDGELIALGGLDAPMMSGHAYIWLALTDAAKSHVVSVVREAERQIDELLLVRQTLASLVFAADKRSVDFARFLGFLRQEETVINGEVAYTMVTRRLRSA